MSKRIDLTGQKFGKLTVIKYICKDERRQSHWLCKCECGNETITTTGRLRSGTTQSCGCIRKEKLVLRSKKHGCSHSRIDRIYNNMKSRCFNPKFIEYNLYGGRGITVCDEWKNDSTKFFRWAMENGYSDDLTLDRIDSNGNYEPSNCRWMTLKEQQNNRRNNRLITYNGKTQTAAKWADEVNISQKTLHSRLRHGWSIEKALTSPVRQHI